MEKSSLLFLGGTLLFLLRIKGVSKHFATSSSSDTSDAKFQSGETRFHNQVAWGRKLKALRSGGKEHLRVVVDFDYTLTTFWVKSSESNETLRGFSSHRTVEASGLLGQAVEEELDALRSKYFPIEVSQQVTREEKYAAMAEWVRQSHQIFIKSKLKKSDIQVAVRQGKMQLRPGVAEFLETLEKNNIPLLVFSAGLADVVEEFLRQQGQLRKNIHVISNRMVFDDEGILIGFHAEMSNREPFHVLNKRFSRLPPELKTKMWKTWGDDHTRATVLLVGDSLDDCHMSDGLLPGQEEHGYRELRIGFLSFNIQNRLRAYKAAFDGVVLKDGDFSLPNEVLRQVLDSD